MLAADPSLRRLPGLYRLVLAPLAAAVRSLGVAAELTDRDIVAAGGKLSGVAAWLGGRALLVHATLLVDADLDALARVCNGPGAAGDPRWERTQSRRVRVTSIARELGVGAGGGGGRGGRPGGVRRRRRGSLRAHGRGGGRHGASRRRSLCGPRLARRVDGHGNAVIVPSAAAP